MDHADDNSKMVLMQRLPTDEEWEDARAEVYERFIINGNTLLNVKRAMEESGFVASLAMYKTRIRRWGMSKNNKESDWYGWVKVSDRLQFLGRGDLKVMMHRKVCRECDFNNYLRVHGFSKEDFFDRARRSRLPIAAHISVCDSDGREVLLPWSLAEVDKPRTGIGDLTSMDDILSNPLAHPGTPPADIVDASLKLTHTLVSDQETPFEYFRNRHAYPTQRAATSQTEDTTLPGGVLNPIPRKTSAAVDVSSLPLNIHWPEQSFNMLEDPTISVALANMSYLSSFHNIASETSDRTSHGADFCLLKPPEADGDLAKASAGNSSASSIQSRPIQTSPSEHEGTPYIAECEVAAVYGAVWKKELLGRSLAMVQNAFKRMLCSETQYALVAAMTTLTWLSLHVKKGVCQKIMAATLKGALEVHDEQHPICQILEWMACSAVGGTGLKTCRIDTTLLRAAWEFFDQTQGRAHGLTIVALYCYCFHLIGVDKAFETAEHYLEDLSAVAAQTRGCSDVLTINILATLSRAQARQKKYHLALKTINRCLHDAPLGLNHPHRLELLLRKAIILRKLSRPNEVEALYWIVVRGRVATLGAQHDSTIAAHNSLIHILDENGTWKVKMDEAQRLLKDPRLTVSAYESWGRQQVELHRDAANQDLSSSDEEDRTIM